MSAAPPLTGSALHRPEAVAPGLSFGIDLLRHLFCVAVIVQHMASASRYSPQTQHALSTVSSWVDGAVFGFFFLSGYLFRPPGDMRAHVRKQAWRLLLPFLVFSLLYAGALAAAGKASLASGLVATLTLQGAGMQLYFLPFLLVVSVCYAGMARGSRAAGVALPCIAVLAAACVSLLLPTDSSSGPHWRLLPLYFCAYATGALVWQWMTRRMCWPGLASIILLAAGLGLADPRFFDLAAAVAAFALVLALQAGWPAHRLPGSGGVFLLHTPLANFAISALLARLGVAQGLNVVMSVALTYALCLAVTLFVVRRWPRARWLMLE